MMDFDPVKQVRFRGKPLTALSQSELLEALVDALKQVKFLEETRPPGVWPSQVPAEGPITPRPFPPPNRFS